MSSQKLYSVLVAVFLLFICAITLYGVLSSIEKFPYRPCSIDEEKKVGYVRELYESLLDFVLRCPVVIEGIKNCSMIENAEERYRCIEEVAHRAEKQCFVPFLFAYKDISSLVEFWRCYHMKFGYEMIEIVCKTYDNQIVECWIECRG